MPAALSFYIPVTPKPPERILIRPPSNCSSAPSPSPMYLMARLCDPSSYTRTRRNSNWNAAPKFDSSSYHHIIASITKLFTIRQIKLDEISCHLRLNHSCEIWCKF